MIQLALIPLLCAAIVLFHRYGIAAAAHPGIWFSFAWVLAISCYTLTDWFNGVPVHNQGQIDELVTFLFFASAAFVIFARLFPKPPRSLWRRDHILEINPRPLLIGAGIGLTAALVNWYFMTGGAIYDDAVRQQWLDEIPVLTARMWWPYMATYPASFISSYLATADLIRLRHRRQVLLALGLTIAAGLFWALGTGGRQAFGIVILHVLAGCALSLRLTYKNNKRRPLSRTLRKAVVGAMLLLMALAAVTEVTGRIRAEQQGRDSAVNSIPYLGIVSEFADYMGQPIATYQAFGPAPRRDLSETGPVSLAAIQGFGVRYLVGWRRPGKLDTNPERAKGWLPLSSGTRCVFYDFVADFGYSGALIAVAALIFLSQMFFSLYRGSKMILGSSPLVMMLMFWGYSHQLSLLMFDGPTWLIISFGLWDLAYIAVPHQSRRHSRPGPCVRSRGITPELVPLEVRPLSMGVRRSLI
jgi:hypothetical protein